MAAGSRYGVTLKQLRELMEHRGLEGVAKMADLGGSTEIARKLNTSPSAGLNGDSSDLEHRRDVFGSNTIPPKPPKTFLMVSWALPPSVPITFKQILFTACMGSLTRCDTHHLGSSRCCLPGFVILPATSTRRR